MPRVLSLRLSSHALQHLLDVLFAPAAFAISLNSDVTEAYSLAIPFLLRSLCGARGGRHVGRATDGFAVAKFDQADAEETTRGGISLVPHFCNLSVTGKKGLELRDWS